MLLHSDCSRAGQGRAEQVALRRDIGVPSGDTTSTVITSLGGSGEVCSAASQFDLRATTMKLEIEWAHHASEPLLLRRAMISGVVFEHRKEGLGQNDDGWSVGWRRKEASIPGKHWADRVEYRVYRVLRHRNQCRIEAGITKSIHPIEINKYSHFHWIAIKNSYYNFPV